MSNELEVREFYENCHLDIVTRHYGLLHIRIIYILWVYFFLREYKERIIKSFNDLKVSNDSELSLKFNNVLFHKVLQSQQK